MTAIGTYYSKNGMSTLVETRPRASSIDFTDDYLVVRLEDARILQIPLIWYPRLFNAPKDKLLKFEWIGKGTGIHWPDLDEHLSIQGFLDGQH